MNIFLNLQFFGLLLLSKLTQTFFKIKLSYKILLFFQTENFTVLETIFFLDP